MSCDELNYAIANKGLYRYIQHKKLKGKNI